MTYEYDFLLVILIN